MPGRIGDRDFGEVVVRRDAAGRHEDAGNGVRTDRVRQHDAAARIPAIEIAARLSLGHGIGALEQPLKGIRSCGVRRGRCSDGDSEKIRAAERERHADDAKVHAIEKAIVIVVAENDSGDDSERVAEVLIGQPVDRQHDRDRIGRAAAVAGRLGFDNRVGPDAE